MAEELTMADYCALEGFRYEIRRFLHFSEAAAREERLEPQQHQLMLAVRRLEDGELPTIGQLAERLLIRHHSAVGLVDRLAERGLIERIRGAADRRQVRIRLTAEGAEKLKRLAGAHREELRRAGPALARILRELKGEVGRDVSTNEGGGS